MKTGAAAAPCVTAEVVSRISDLLPIQPEWVDFAKAQQVSTPFQLPQWLLTWWTHFRNGELRTWIFRREHRLVGIVPCFLHCWEGRRQLTLAGTGISDYLEPLVAPELRTEMAHLLAEGLDRYSDWDLAVWQDLNNESFLSELNPGAGFSMTVEKDTSCAEVLINGSFDEYWAARPHGLKRNVHRYLKKASEIDTPQFAVTRRADHEALSSLLRLHTERWGRQGESGMIASNRSAGFLRDVVEVFAADGLIHLFTLRFQGRIAAVILAFAYRGTLSAYLSGFDPEYEGFGFGRLLLFEAIRYAFQTRYTKWSFLRGTEPYKFDWGAREVPKQRVTLRRIPDAQ